MPRTETPTPIEPAEPGERPPTALEARFRWLGRCFAAMLEPVEPTRRNVVPSPAAKEH